MKIMSKDKWNRMSDDARIKHLLDNDLEYNCKPVMRVNNGKQKRDMIMRYQAMMGGVMMSNWHPSKQAAAEEALENTAGFVSDIVHQRGGILFGRNTADGRRQTTNGKRQTADVV